MSGYKENFKVKDLTFSNNVFYAPLAGYSDLPFRKMCKQYNPGLVFCEMVKIEALVRHDTNSYKLLDFDYTMHPIGAQLCGSNIALAKEAACILEDLGFDWIDFNCGCPVDKVTKDGSGSAMLKTPNLIGDIISEISSSTKLPISVKIRAGWDSRNLNALEITSIAEQAGADVIFIHGRTAKQGYKGNADWEIIKLCKEKAKKILVFGNGDLFDEIAVRKMFEQTDCDGVLLARGMIGKPWFVKAVANHYNDEQYPVDALRIKNEMVQHFEFIKSYQIEKKALLDMRRLGSWYLHWSVGAKKLKIGINMAQSTSEIMEIIHSFDWEKIGYKNGD